MNMNSGYFRKYRRATLAACLFAAQLCACGGKPAALPPLAADARVLAFGDSLTAGTGASTEQAYPAQLALLVRREVINAGVPGETTAEGRARLPAVLDESHPQLVILCEGGNDMLRRLDRGSMRENLAAMIREIQGRGIAVVLLAVPAPGLLRLRPDQTYSELAKEFKLPLLEDKLSEILADNQRKSDQIHPNAAGYRELAVAIAALLHGTGAV